MLAGYIPISLHVKKKGKKKRIFFLPYFKVGLI
jgi:hypothetical protein